MKYIFLHMNIMQEEMDIDNLQKIKRRFKAVGDLFYLGKDYRILNPECISIGNNFSAGTRFRMEAIDEYQEDKFIPQIIIKNNNSFGTDVHIGCINYIEIGNGCLFGSRILITDHNHGNTEENNDIPPQKRQLISKGPIVIGDNVWIGDGVVIMPNVTIGENAIIAANAVVTKDVLKSTVVAGVPAKMIKN